MYDDLFSQARMLATFDPGKPKQANLRRAVSSAYYALFHFLVDQACRAQIGTQHSQAGYRHAIARAFSHAVMKQACTSFGGGTLKSTVLKGLPATFSVPPEIRTLAGYFVELQEKRHQADYDLSERFQRVDVMTQITMAESCVTHFALLPSSDEKRFFLACLWAWSGLVNR